MEWLIYLAQMQFLEARRYVLHHDPSNFQATHTGRQSTECPCSIVYILIPGLYNQTSN